MLMNKSILFGLLTLLSLALNSNIYDFNQFEVQDWIDYEKKVECSSDDESPTHLSPISKIALFVAFALFSGSQPILVKLFIPKTVKRNVVIFCTESAKLIMSLLILLIASSGCMDAILENWTLSSAFFAAGVPSVLFVIQAYCNMFAIQQLQPVTFVVLNRTKIIWTAICCYFILGQRQSRMQIIALLLLILATLWLRKIIPICCTRSFINQHLQRKEAGGGETENEDEIEEEDCESLLKETSVKKTSIAGLEEKEEGVGRNDSVDDVDEVVVEQLHRLEMLGVSIALFAGFLSGLSGSITQLTLQQNNRNPHLFNIELSIFSIAVLVLNIASNKLFSLFQRSQSSRSEIEKETTNKNNVLSKDNCNDEKLRKAESAAAATEGGEHLFVGFTWSTWIPILSQAVSNILIGLVTKHMGAVTKVFISVFGMGISSILQHILFKDTGGLSFEELFGVSLCAVSLWLYVMY